MTYPIVFGTLAAGNQPASDFDTMFNVVGQQGALPCTGTGTNAISLTPGTNNYVPAAYTNGQLATFEAGATSTGAMTMQLAGLGFVNLYNASGNQANAGDVTINVNYLVAYFSNLNSGAGGFQILNSQTNSGASITQPTQGSFKNLVLTVAGNTTMTPTADEIILQNASGGTVRVSSYAPAATSTATVGANGLDSGTVAINTWYAWYAIYDAATATAAGLFSTSFTSPTLPSGYTYYALLGAFLTDGSGNLYRILQKGRRGQYVIGTNPANSAAVTIAHGTAGTYSTTSPTLAAVSVAGLVPPIAATSYLGNNTNYAAGALGAVVVAPTTAWGGSNNGPNGSNGNTYPIAVAPSGSVSYSYAVEIMLETTSVAWTSNGPGSAISVTGWTLNL